MKLDVISNNLSSIFCNSGGSLNSAFSAALVSSTDLAKFILCIGVLIINMKLFDESVVCKK